MATAIVMPKQGQSVESCIIAGWKKAVGDSVAEGDVHISGCLLEVDPETKRSTRIEPIFAPAR